MSEGQTDTARRLQGLWDRFLIARVKAACLVIDLPDEAIMTEALNHAIAESDVEFAEMLVAVAERYVELAEGKTWGQVTGHA